MPPRRVAPRRLVATAGQLLRHVMAQVSWGQLGVAVAVAAIPVLVTLLADERTVIGTVTTLRIVLAIVAVGTMSWLVELSDDVADATPVPAWLPVVIAVVLIVPVLAAVVVGLVGPLLDHLVATQAPGGFMIGMARQMGVAVVGDLAWESVALVLLGWAVTAIAGRLGHGNGVIVGGPVVLAVTAAGTRWPKTLPLLPALQPDPGSTTTDMPTDQVWHTWLVAHTTASSSPPWSWPSPWRCSWSTATAWPACATSSSAGGDQPRTG